MKLNEAEIRFLEIFNPGFHEELEKIEQNHTRFAYYCSAETAVSILENTELWFHSASMMNGFSEISYGSGLALATFSGSTGARLREAVDDIFPGTMDQVERLVTEWIPDWESETYIASLSMHEDHEDATGRLSLWRAYGDTALVMHNTPILASTDKLGVYSIPVSYLSREGYKDRLDAITDLMLMNWDYLKGLGQETLVSYVLHMMFLTTIGTKHPGLSEEKEWRLFYRPNEEPSRLMRRKTRVVRGVPQIIHVLPLAHSPDNDLHGADIPSLLDRVIIGPTEYPQVSAGAFRAILEKGNVADAKSKVVASGIPLRRT